jgi:hypothetical protein
MKSSIPPPWQVRGSPSEGIGFESNDPLSLTFLMFIFSDPAPRYRFPIRHLSRDHVLWTWHPLQGKCGSAFVSQAKHTVFASFTFVYMMPSCAHHHFDIVLPIILISCCPTFEIVLPIISINFLIFFYIDCNTHTSRVTGQGSSELGSLLYCPQLGEE